jgi:hypothetical protein
MSKQFASVSSKITRLALVLSKDNNTLGKLRNTFLTKHLIDHIGSENTIHVHISYRDDFRGIGGNPKFVFG